MNALEVIILPTYRFLVKINETVFQVEKSPRISSNKKPLPSLTGAREAKI